MSKKLTKDEIISAFEQMMPELLKMMANMSGSKVRGTITEDAKMEFANLVESFQKFQDIDLSKLNVSERKKQFGELSNMLKGMLGIKGDKNIFEILAEHSASSLEISTKDNYLRETNFLAYKDSLFKIVEKMFTANKVQDVRNYFNTIPIEDLYSFSQNAVRLDRQLPFLRRKYRRITRQVVEKYISIYRDLTIIMEVLVKQLIAIRKILDREPAEYMKIKNDSLANHVSSLNKVPHFSKLIAPFNITIRNAMAHGSTALEPISESIRFTDRRKTIRIKYDEFLIQTRELAAAVIVIISLSAAMNSYAFQIAKRNFT